MDVKELIRRGLWWAAGLLLTCLIFTFCVVGEVYPTMVRLLSPTS